KATELKGKKIRVSAKRSDKSFPMGSQDINRVIGASLVEAGCGVDLKNPEATVFIEILPGRALISTEKIRGPGGLPVGSSGKLLSLLSGGIDSPVSSWLMMKRGCTVDLLHLHQSPQNKDVLDTKMKGTVAAIARYSPKPMRFYAAPYTEFYKKSMEMRPRIELVLFRRFLLLLSNRLAKEHGYLGVVTGDSVGQVASQTLENLFATDEAASIPVYRPLSGLNKQEIIDLSLRIGTYDLSIQPYKDCCSLVANKNPSTKVPLDLAKEAEEEIGMDAIVEKTLEKTEIFDISA
ncbi:MAG: tRNA sulfurtransferase, partial [Candidatus Micrarchaeota archaeon]